MSEEESSKESSEDSNNSEPSGNFLDGIESEYREDPSISKFDNLNDLAKEHVNLQSLLGRKGVIVPNENDSDDVWNKYRSEIGVPSSYEKYSIPDGAEEDSIHSRIAKKAHELNVSSDQYSEIMSQYDNWYNEIIESGEKEAESKTQENIDILKKDWGRAYDAKANLGATALNTITNGQPESVASIQLADGTLLGNNPDFIKAMASIGENMTEKGMLDGKSVNNSAISPEEAHSRLNEMMQDPEKFKILFSGDFHPSKEELVKQRQRLLSFAYPNGEPG
tara:strand:+ start:4452 stop:5288 length:837 start_codon:yes stop_codon:yes gene_type:complete